MKLLFVHGSKIKVDNNGKLYTDGSFNEQVWNRYLNFANELTVITRREKTIYDPTDAVKKFNKFNNERIKFVEVYNTYTSSRDFINIKYHIMNNNIIGKEVKNQDIIIIRFPCWYGKTVIKFAKKYRKPYLIEVVGCVWDSYWNHSIKGKIMAPYSYLIMKSCIKKAPFALYVTNEFLQKRYPCKGKIIACSDVLMLKNDEEVLKKRLIKIKNMSPDKKIIIGTIAAVNVRYKGQQYIIKALGKLKKRGITNYEYHLVGGGDQTYLQKIAEKYNVADQVKFIGSIAHREVFDWLDNIDIYVQPSRTEGLPRALIEAISRGCPALGSKAGGIPELLGPEFLFSKLTVSDIYRTINRMNTKTMIKAAVHNFDKSKEFDSDSLNKRRSSFFQEFISSLDKQKI